MRDGPPFRTYRWSIFGTINAAVFMPFWALIGWWWLIPPMLLLVALGWYFSVCSTWFAGHATVYKEWLRRSV